MKTVFILLIASAAVGVIAVYALFTNNNGSDSVAVTSVETESEKVTAVESGDELETLSGLSSLSDLRALRRSLECQIRYDAPDQTGVTTGTYFVSGEKVRGDFVVNAPELGGSVVSSVIYNRNTLYTWSDINGELYGAKFPVENYGEMESTTMREPIPSDVAVSYECREWTNVDGSIFEPPSDVLFQDLTNILESGMEFGTVYEEGEF